MVTRTKNQINMMTVSCKYVDLNDLKPDDIDITDIAHALSQLCRYNGHTNRFLSVAEHCVRLARYAYTYLPKEDNFNVEVAKALLLHDATEAYVGDVIYPLKKFLPEFTRLEDKIGARISAKFGVKLTDEMEAKLKEFDRRICFDEMYVLFNGHVDNKLYEENIRPLGVQHLLIDEQDRFGWNPLDSYEKYLVVAEVLGIYERPKQIIEEPVVAKPLKKRPVKKIVKPQPKARKKK